MEEPRRDHSTQQALAIGLERRWASLSSLLVGSQDLLGERPDASLDGAPPPALSARGWVEWLNGLDDAAVAHAERAGLLALERADCPESLRTLLAELNALTALPHLRSLLGPPPPKEGLSARKRAQVQAFAGVVLALWPDAVRRVVDLGSGHGHLTCHLASALGVSALGVERNPLLAQTATRRAYAAAEFVTADLMSCPPPLGEGDLVVGLHACGELGDLAVKLAAQSGARLALVGCCAQKYRTPQRQSLCEPRVSIAREHLGLANLSPHIHGVEADLEVDMEARRCRVVVRQLLAMRGFVTAPGEELSRVNRRVARRGAAALGEAALAVRGAGAPTEGELVEAHQRGTALYGLFRRWMLVRASLGRALEVSIAVDRALALERQGLNVVLGQVFEASVSPRNLMLCAWR